MGNKCCGSETTSFAQLFGTWHRIKFLLIWQFLLCCLSVIYSILQMQGSKVAVPPSWPTGTTIDGAKSDLDWASKICADTKYGFYYWAPFSFDLQSKNDPSASVNLSCGYPTNDTIWRLIVAILALICIVIIFWINCFAASWLSVIYCVGDKVFFFLTLFYYAALVNDIKCFQIGSSACANSFYFEKDLIAKEGFTVNCTMSLFLITIAIDFVCGSNLLLIWRAWSCCPELKGQPVATMHLPVATSSSRDIVTTVKQQEQPSSSFAFGEREADKVPSTTTSKWFFGTKQQQTTHGKRIQNHDEEGTASWLSSL